MAFAAASALMLATAAPAAAAGYPLEAVLQEFTLACASLDSLDAAHKDAAANGWREFAPAGESQLGQLIAFGRAAVAQEGGIRETGGKAFEKKGGTGMLYLVTSEVAVAAEDGAAGMTSRGCRLYDFEAPLAPTQQQLTAWAGREPGSWTTPAPGMVKAEWNPGLREGQVEMSAVWLPLDNPLRPMMHLSGLSLANQSIDLTASEGAAPKEESE